VTADSLEPFETEEQSLASAEPAAAGGPAIEPTSPQIEPADAVAEAGAGPAEPVPADVADAFAAVSNALWSAPPPPPDPPEFVPAPAAAPAVEPSQPVAPVGPEYAPTDAATSQAIAELANTLDWRPPEPDEPPQRRHWFRRSPKRAKTKVKARTSRKRLLLGFLAAFVVSALLGFFLVLAVAIGVSESYANRVVPGVRVGTVDLSGLTRDQAMARLQSNFSYLSKGEVTVTTPVGTTTITYEEAGRRPDVDAMADAAMAVGHSGNLIVDSATLAHSAAYGQIIPVVVQLDPNALAQRLRQLVGTSTIEPQNAQAITEGGAFSVTAATTGHGIDERTIQASIIDQLALTTAPADFTAGGTFTAVAPQITEKDAQDAVTRAQRMAIDVHLVWTQKPPAAPADWKPQTWTIPAAEIRNWIVFGLQTDGTYGPAINPDEIQAYVAKLTAGVGTKPVEPHVIWDPSTGKPASLADSQNGVGIDARATTAEVEAYLDALAAGKDVVPELEIATGWILPQIVSIDSISGMVMVGGHTTVFYPDISNGMGKNIRQPALNLDGKVIAPGAQFSFLGYVGPIDAAHGFAMGGVIVHGKSNHTGAMGGGICSASTTLFNAAADAGLQIDERHAHFYYINRYPVGRDATVFSDGYEVWDVKWTNDTPYPIVIRAWTTYGSKSTITIQLWTWPLNRTTTWSGGGMVDIVKAGENAPIYTDTLPAGQKARAEYATDGFKTSVTRVVTDSTGKVIHNDTWGSTYGMVNGQLLIGTGPTP
jgi:vancomycin resistance protein YoaR